MENKVLEALQVNIGKELSGSPSRLGVWLNGIIREVERGRLVIEFTVREEMLNSAGLLHGGALTAMMDEVMGITAASLGQDGFFTTVNLQVDFLNPAKVGEKLLVKSEVVREGNSIVNTSCEAKNLDGKLIAKGGSNLYKVVRKTV